MTDVDDKLTSSLSGEPFIGTELGEFSWIFRLADKAFVKAVSPWRILCNGRVTYGKSDHAQNFGRAIDGVAECNRLLKGERILKVSVKQDTNDLTIDFTGNASLEIVNISGSYEGWILEDGAGHVATASGGSGVEQWSDVLSAVGWKDKGSFFNDNGSDDPGS